jgi:hypothetical protein
LYRVLSLTVWWAWNISCHKTSGRIVVALRENGIQFVNNFVAHTQIIVQNIYVCFGVTWVDDNVYVSGSDSDGKGRIDILDSNGQHISSISSVSSIGIVLYIHHRDNNIYYTDLNSVYCIKKDGSKVFTFSSPDFKGLYGIDTDRQGNVYVVVSDSNNIFIQLPKLWPLISPFLQKWTCIIIRLTRRKVMSIGWEHPSFVLGTNYRWLEWITESSIFTIINDNPFSPFIFHK